MSHEILCQPNKFM